MRFTMPKGVEHHRLHRSPDGLDGLLREFFQGEMPDPWPRAPGARAPRRVLAPSSWHRFRGRLALAAAVAFFLVGSFLLTRGFPEVKETGKDGGPGQALPINLGQDPKKQRHHDADKVFDQQPPYQQQETPPIKLEPVSGKAKVLPLERGPRGDRSWGAIRPNGEIIMTGVADKKAP
jgi:hypothetical protein